MSISSIYEETSKMREVHKSETVLCTVPGDPLLLKYTKFENRNFIFEFSRVLSYFENLENLMVHIPESRIRQFQVNLKPKDFCAFRKVRHLHFNIMLQNIELLLPLEYITSLKEFGKVTCTTAHEKYSTLEIRDRLGIPLHRLSTYISPEQYKKTNYREKENLLLVSPDKHPRKEEVLALLTKHFKNLKIQIILDLSYSEYKNLVARAKWSLTFGEGLDGYFLEPIFSGGISFSVYRTEFFTADFREFRTIYEDYNSLIQKICFDIQEMDNEKSYSEYQTRLYKHCCKYYDFKQYLNNLKLFYEGKYTFK